MLLALLGVVGCCQLSVLLGLVERYWELSGDAGGCWELSCAERPTPKALLPKAKPKAKA